MDNVDEENSAMENKEVQVSLFDYNVENFFSSFSPFFGKNSSINSDPGETDCFSSTITFLSEWKHFNYEPRNISFSNQSKIELPQFSSVAVPQVKQLAGESNSPHSDFVLYAGGNVWALDWCPRSDNKPDSSITCEYLAVSAHPPGSNYHKIGAPLSGRGVIQIWAIITKTEKFESTNSENTTKKRKPQKEGLIAKEPKDLTVSQPRGRPKKIIEKELVKSPKKRGRPRKTPFDEDFCVNTPKKKGKFEKCVTLNDEIPLSVDTSETLLALPSPPLHENSIKTGTKTENLPEKRPKRQVKSKYLRNECRELITTNEVENYESTLPPIIDPVDTTLPLCILYNKKQTKRKLKNKPRKNQEKELTSQQNSLDEVVALPMPSLIFCLAHNGKVAWDIKWKPIINIDNNINNNNSTNGMGYLAVLLGDGSLEVWEVPFPSTVQKLYASNKIEGTDPRFVKLKPVFKCSKLKCGDKQSIPLTLEWSTSPPNDFILAGCHDGTVALWKFSVQIPSQDSKPLLFFTADSVPIRSLSWAPYESDDAENSNIFVTAGSEGLKFWDIRDPYHPLWELIHAQRSVMSVDWLKNPRCVMMSMEDGTVKILSIPRAANDLPVTGSLFNGRKLQYLFSYTLSLFNIWSVHVSRATGCVAYCVADGSAVRFQLNERFLEKEPGRNRVPYFLCGSFKENKKINTINISNENINNIIKNLPLKPLKGPSRYKGDEKAVVVRENSQEQIGDVEEKCDEISDSFPNKLVAIHKVRWNMNKGCEKWLSYGGAAGIIRVQKIPLS